MQNTFRNIIMAVLMLLAAGVAMAIHPTHRIADDGPPVDLEKMVPKAFADWRLVEKQTAYIINPQTKAMLNVLYSQTLSRSYVNANGEAIMLSIAYGADQSDAKQLHYPEVCYPAQGFQLLKTDLVNLSTKFGEIRSKQLVAVLGLRTEPVTYWTTVANKVVRGSKETKLAQLKYGFNGQIPDGLLFRVSTVTQNTDRAFELESLFVKELAAAIDSDARVKLMGL